MAITVYFQLHFAQSATRCCSSGDPLMPVASIATITGSHGLAVGWITWTLASKNDSASFICTQTVELEIVRQTTAKPSQPGKPLPSGTNRLGLYHSFARDLNRHSVPSAMLRHNAVGIGCQPLPTIGPACTPRRTPLRPAQKHQNSAFRCGIFTGKFIPLILTLTP